MARLLLLHALMATNGSVIRETEPTPVRILVVDDSAVARAIVGHGLKAAGMRVDDAKSAGEALQLLAGNTYDVVISDLCMPGVDGFALLVRIKMQAPATQVIILSGLEDCESATKALKLGAHEYLPKPPAHPGDVLAAVRRVLEAKRLRDLRPQPKASRRDNDTSFTSFLPPQAPCAPAQETRTR